MNLFKSVSKVIYGSMANKGFEILNAGPDLRAVTLDANKHMFYGFPFGSAMDYKSVMAVNQVLGKEPNSKVLECSLKACKLRANEDSFICVGGADMGWKIDSETIEGYQCYEINTGQILSGGFSKNGLRSYIAFSREIDEVSGNHIIFQNDSEKSTPQPKAYQFKVNNNLVIHRGPEWNLLDQKSKEAMMIYSARISPNLSRMGTYLDGKVLTIKTNFPKQSVCTFPGVIQLLPSGQLLVLAQDAQTTGGYPRIAYLDKDNLADFNQLPIGKELKWRLEIL